MLSSLWERPEKKMTIWLDQLVNPSGLDERRARLSEKKAEGFSKLCPEMEWWIMFYGGDEEWDNTGGLRAPCSLT